MNTTFIEDIIKRSNMRLTLLSTGGLVLVLLGVLLSANYLMNFIGGPFKTSKDQVLSYTDPGQISRNFVTLRGDDVFDTGFQYVTTTDSGKETVDNSYAALLLDDRLLLVETQGAATDFPLEYTGALVPIPGELQQNVVHALEQDIPEVSGAFLPFMLKTENYRFNGFIGLVIGAVVLLLSLWGIARALIRSGDLTKHPIMAGLARFGDPRSIAQQLDLEMSQHHIEAGNIHLTRNWILYKTASNLQATRLSDLVWVYKQVTQHRTNGIPTGKTFSALLWDRYNVKMTVSLRNETGVHDLLSTIADTAPWVIVGYDDKLNNAWKRDRSSFISAVDERRKRPMPQNS